MSDLSGSPTRDTAATEPWQRHAWDESHQRCVECHHEWPCDIAKAINYGIGMGRMMERYGSARRPLPTEFRPEFTDA